MIQKTIPLLLLFFISNICAQAQKDGITFEVEKLKRAGYALAEIPGEELTGNIAPQALVSSVPSSQQVYLGAHPFFNGMYKAYAEHRPFELSPDMIWLLICQGFAHHVNNNAEALRGMFVHYDGKKSLMVKTDYTQPLDKMATWENIIPQFLQKAAEDTGEELFANLTPTFSTTGSTERIVTQITALESMKAYYEYVVLYIACGIPEITLRGTTEDWKLVAAKAQQLKKYRLEWWIDAIDPLLQQFIKASEGTIDKPFWRDMFKYHTEKTYGAPKVIDGWIVKFFPYDNKRKRNTLQSIRSAESLPDERVAVDFKLIKINDHGDTETKPMQFIAGFTGLRQDPKTLRLSPQIGWLVTPAMADKSYAHELAEDAKSNWGIHIRVSELPQEILTLGAINAISIDFIDSINIPGQLSKLKIGTMRLNGIISEAEEQRIAALFPETNLYINEQACINKQYYIRKEQEEKDWEELLRASGQSK